MFALSDRSIKVENGSYGSALDSEFQCGRHMLSEVGVEVSWKRSRMLLTGGWYYVFAYRHVHSVDLCSAISSVVICVRDPETS